MYRNAVVSRWFQLTAARRRLLLVRTPYQMITCFNSQPPEGGWAILCEQRYYRAGFNSQPPEGGWFRIDYSPLCSFMVSTHSRPKAAGCDSF